MKKLVVLLVVVLTTTVLVGCKPVAVTGEFYGAKGEILTSQEVKDGDSVYAPGGAKLHIRGFINKSDVTIEAISGTKLYPEVAVISTVSFAVIATVMVLFAGEAGFGQEFDYTIPILNQDVRVNIGQEFHFSLVRQIAPVETPVPITLVPTPSVPNPKPPTPPAEGEGEGEGQHPAEGEGEGEGEGETPSNEITYTVVSPTAGTVVTVGASVEVKIDIASPKGPVDVIIVSPDQEVKRDTGVLPPKTVSHAFVLTAKGTGNFTITVKNGAQSVVRSIPVVVQ